MIGPIFKGMATTLKHFFKPHVTIEYPEIKRPVRNRFKGRHHLERYDNGLEKCIGCALCAAACPADAIFVEASENTDEVRFSPGERYASTYENNMLRCIYCGMCEEACPKDAIELTKVHDWAAFSREEMIWDKEKLLDMYEKTNDEKWMAERSLTVTPRHTDW